MTMRFSSERGSSRRRCAVVLVVAFALTAATGCQSATAGRRCRGNGFGQQGAWILQCQRGRWTRVMTKADYVHLLVALNRSAGTPQSSLSLGPGTTSAPPTLAPPTTPPTMPPTTTTPPEVTLDRLQLVYVTTSDQVADATMEARIVSTANATSDWFAAQSGGRRPRFLTSGGAVSVVSVQLAATRAEVEARTVPLATLLANAGYSSPANVMDVVWIDTDGIACGATGSKQITIWMAECSIYPSSPATFPYGATYLLAHEITHALGAVPSCAPNYVVGGHLSSDNRDVLYTGSEARDWQNLMLDPGNDDYFRHAIPGCDDIEDSPLW